MHIMVRISALAQITQGLAISGRGAGTRAGDWRLRMATSGDVNGGWLVTDGLREVRVEQNPRTERHLLKPYDILVAARGGEGRAALVPPGVSRTVAGVTLLVVRPRDPGLGMGHYLWYFLTSAYGEARIRRATRGTSVPLLTAGSMAEIMAPMPSTGELDLFARLVEASEEAYASAVHAARLRRAGLRDALIREVIEKEETTLMRNLPCR